MTKIGDRIKKIRTEKLKMSQVDMANAIGVSKQTLYKYENNIITNIPSDKIEAIARLAHVTPAYLMGWNNTATVQQTRIPIIGSVRAGIPNDAIEDVVDYEEITPEMAMRGKLFGLKIRGDSMEPRIKDGDVVIVLETPDVENGDLAVVLVDGNDATIKQISKTADALTLIPFNTSYTPIVYTAEQCKTLPVQIIGKVIELRAKF